MKRIIAILLITIIALSMFGCGKKNKEEPVGGNIVNPLHEATEEEVANVMGEIMLPAGAEDIKYFTIDGSEKLYEIRFTLEGTEYNYRASVTDALKDISGMYYTWKETQEASVEGRDAKVCFIDGQQGIIYWYDVVPGIVYSLSVDKGASFNSLVDMANNIFVPVQGEVG